MNFHLYLTPYTNMNSKWITDQNIKTKIVKLEDNPGGNVTFDYAKMS